MAVGPFSTIDVTIHSDRVAARGKLAPVLRRDDTTQGGEVSRQNERGVFWRRGTPRRRGCHTARMRLSVFAQGP